MVSWYGIEHPLLTCLSGYLPAGRSQLLMASG
uniref:Uncharacterized protein n=1 Tax=Anguilla anguilla TaxID=7936 RepID=A0A0E9PV03_ANGAN